MPTSPTTAGGREVLAAIDIGSNSIKMTVARRTADGFEEIDWRTETVRLGQGLDETGRLAEDRIDAAVEVLRRYAELTRAHGAARTIGVATEATRVAANGADFLERVGQETGIELQAISGDREAELTFRGLDGEVSLGGPLVVADIGGGSTELIVARDRQVEWSKSHALGSGRLTDRLVPHDPPQAAELDSCRRHAAETIAEAPLPESGARLVVVGGTGEYLMRLVPPGAAPTPEIVDGVLERLTTIESGDLAALIDVQVSRARVLPAGIAIARAVADRVKPAAIEVARSGIRRGLLQAGFAGEL